MVAGKWFFGMVNRAGAAVEEETVTVWASHNELVRFKSLESRAEDHFPSEDTLAALVIIMEGRHDRTRLIRLLQTRYCRHVKDDA